MLINIDGIKLDISKFSKKITFRHVGEKIEITFALDFPLYTEAREFDTEALAKEFINSIKKDGDKVLYK